MTEKNETTAGSGEKKKNLPAEAYYRWLKQGCPIDDESNPWAEAKRNADAGVEP